MQLPELESVSALGTRRVWKVTVYDGKYTIEHGTLGGKIVTVERAVKVKNVGKANETTLFEQALSEARSKWNKKIDEGYLQRQRKGDVTVDYPTGGTAVEPTIVRHSVLPMLAQKYDSKKSFPFPCSVQPKLDGVRAVYHGGALWSRLGKLLPEVNFIADQLLGVRAILDGELYCHELTFQEIISAVKKTNGNTRKIQYVVYDTINSDCFPARMRKLKNLLAGHRPNVKTLTTYRCETEKELPTFLANFLAENYEGVMLRSDTGGYVQKYRSKNLQKLKEFVDSEYLIVDFTEGEGSEKGLILFICQCDSGATFTVRPMGTHEHRRELFARGEEFIGKQLTVKYQELTDCGIPRFPIGVAIRDYE